MKNKNLESKMSNYFPEGKLKKIMEFIENNQHCTINEIIIGASRSSRFRENPKEIKKFLSVLITLGLVEGKRAEGIKGHIFSLLKVNIENFPVGFSKMIQATEKIMLALASRNFHGIEKEDLKRELEKIVISEGFEKILEFLVSKGTIKERDGRIMKNVFVISR